MKYKHALEERGKLFGFQNYNVIPDIICIAKRMGGGMPIGCFISSTSMMKKFRNPIWTYITTFGGHPINCASSLKTLEILLKQNLLMKLILKKNYLENF